MTEKQAKRLTKGDRIVLFEKHLGTVVKVGKGGWVFVTWDDGVPGGLHVNDMQDVQLAE